MDEDDEGDEDDGSQKRRDSKSGGPKVKSETSSNSIVPIRPGPPSNDVSASPEVSQPVESFPCHSRC